MLRGDHAVIKLYNNMELNETNVIYKLNIFNKFINLDRIVFDSARELLSSSEDDATCR